MPSHLSKAKLTISVYTKSTVKQKKRKYLITLSLLFLIGAIVGLAGSFLVRNHDQTVLVWAADKNVIVPDGLVSYLEKNDRYDCKNYKGTGTVTGMALFSIYETYGNRLAKMTYGCGNALTQPEGEVLIAYKKEAKWQLLEPARSENCDVLNELDIPASFVKQCTGTNGVRTDR